MNKKKNKMTIILASGSPRRRELLAQAGFEFEVMVSRADEQVSDTDPFEMVEELALRKGMAVARDLTGREEGKDYLVLGADTIVVKDGKVLGKPRDEEDACKMLTLLSGATHQVCTGVAMIPVREGKIGEPFTFHEKTDVVMRDLTEEEIREYIRTKDPMDKAGAYGIQGMAGIFVSEIRGDYYNVVGLPLSATVVNLRKYL